MTTTTTAKTKRTAVEFKLRPLRWSGDPYRDAHETGSFEITVVDPQQPRVRYIGRAEVALRYTEDGSIHRYTEPRVHVISLEPAVICDLVDFLRSSGERSRDPFKRVLANLGRAAYSEAM